MQIHRVRTAVAIALMGLVSLCAGCASTAFVPVDGSSPIELGPDEGLLVFQVDSDLPISRLTLTGLHVGRPIAAGDTFEIVRVPAGRYRWFSLHVPEDDRHGGRYSIDPSRYQSEDELYFEVRPGVLNYAGELVVTRGRRTWFRRAITVRVLNHVGGAIRHLDNTYPDLLDRFELVHARETPDTFLDFYLAQRARIRGGDVAPASGAAQ